MTLKARVIEVLEEGPASAPYVARVLGHDRRSVGATLSVLERDGLIALAPQRAPERHEGTHPPKLYCLK